MWLRFQWLGLIVAATLVTASAASGQTLLDIHKNAGVPCAACHSEEPPELTPPNEVCVTCHGTKLESGDTESPAQPDPHLSLQLEAGEILPCTTCHAVHGAKE